MNTLKVKIGERWVGDGEPCFVIAEAGASNRRKVGPAPEESEMYEKARRSLIAARDILRGTKIEREMIAIKRPGFGIKPKLIDLVVDRVAKVDIEEDTVLA